MAKINLPRAPLSGKTPPAGGGGTKVPKGEWLASEARLRGFHVKIRVRRLRQRQDNPAVPARQGPGRGRAAQHPAGAGTVYFLHRGPHLPGTGGQPLRAGGELFVHQPGREDPLHRGRRGGADPLGCRADSAGPPRAGRAAGQCALLLPPPPLGGVLPDGGGDH